MLGAAAAAVLLAACSGGPELSFDGPDEGDLLNAEQLEAAEIVVTAAGEADRELFAEATVEHDGRDVTADGDPGRRPDCATRSADLDDGDHEVAVDVPGGGSQTFAFSVDATPPDARAHRAGGRGGLRRRPAARSPAAPSPMRPWRSTVTSVDGRRRRQRSSAPSTTCPTRRSRSWPTDVAGNTTEQELALTRLPSRVEVDEVRAVHVTPHAWATPSFRERVLQMFDDGLINAIQLDLKDEGGRIGYRTEVPLARESGAAEDVYDLDEAIEELHGRGIHVVGRIVAFRDPMLGAARHRHRAGRLAHPDPGRRRRTPPPTAAASPRSPTPT